MNEIAKKANEFTPSTEPEEAAHRRLLRDHALAQADARGRPRDLVDLLTAEMAPPVRIAIAQAIGAAPLDEASERQALREAEGREDIRNAAALALILGGDTETAARTVAMYAELERRTRSTDLKDSYFRAFGFWSRRGLQARQPLPLGRERRGHRARQGPRRPAEWARRAAAGAVRQPQVRQRPALRDARRAAPPPHGRRQGRATRRSATTRCRR